MTQRGTHRHWMLNTQPWDYMQDTPSIGRLGRVRAIAARMANNYLEQRYTGKHPASEEVSNAYVSHDLGEIAHRQPYADGITLGVHGVSHVGLRVTLEQRHLLDIGQVAQIIGAQASCRRSMTIFVKMREQYPEAVEEVARDSELTPPLRLKDPKGKQKVPAKRDHQRYLL